MEETTLEWQLTAMLQVRHCPPNRNALESRVNTQGDKCSHLTPVT
jgi:hypothetical protein